MTDNDKQLLRGIASELRLAAFARGTLVFDLLPPCRMHEMAGALDAVGAVEAMGDAHREREFCSWA